MADLFCTACGEPRPEGKRKSPIHVEGDLAELTEDRLAAIRGMSFHEMAEQQAEAELPEFARAGGYHRGWVWHRLREQDQSGARA